MISWFKINGKRIEIDKVKKSGLYPNAYLDLVSNQREWTGIPSVTQLINGTRMEYLKILTPYAIDPDRMAFAVHGTLSHKKLEYKNCAGMAEVAVKLNGITGIVDLIERQDDGSYWLIDFKTWGSYSVSLALGLVKIKKPLFYSDGTPQLYMRNGNGYKKGEQKYEAIFVPDPEKVDMETTELQLNMYRLMVEAEFGIEISKMKVFAIVRDGGTYIAKNRGIDKNTYYFDVKKWEDEDVKKYFAEKREALLRAVNDAKRKGVIQSCPAKCSYKERWGGKRCEDYCDVKEKCFEIGDKNDIL